MPPASFDEELMDDWSLWVLDHGLPQLPDRVRIGESVPVAFWAGPRVGAVVHILATADDPQVGEPDRFDTEVTCFRRIDDRWEAANARGGTDWPPGASLAGIQVAREFVGFGGEMTASGDGPTCTAIDGVVGDDAQWIEVSDITGTVRRPVEAPIGVVVVAVSDLRPVAIRILDGFDRELGRHLLP
jgi:hypothetical protein